MNEHQFSAHKALCRYTYFQGKTILEIGGSSSCDAARPFLEDKAAKVIVTGLDHISNHDTIQESRLQILRLSAFSLSDAFEDESIDVIYGLSVLEHIANPSIFCEQMYKILKPGGIVYLEGNPIWSSPIGHHLWIAAWGGRYQNKATQNYLFCNFPGYKSYNPLPSWSHLAWSRDQMNLYLTNKGIPSQDIECILDWVYDHDDINRLDIKSIAAAYSKSRFIVLEANTTKVNVPTDIQTHLRNICGDNIDFGICGISYILLKAK